MNIFFQTTIAVLIVSFMSLAGVVTFLVKRELLNKITLFLVSLAAGTLIGDVFFHIIPELYESGNEVFLENLPFYIVLGIVAFLILEKFLHWHHCHISSSHEHNHRHIGVNNAVADAIHNFVDGLLIAGGFMASTEIGIATTIAVILHEIPQELGDFGVLIHSGFTKTKALYLNLLSGLIAVVGAYVGLIIGDISEENIGFMLAIAGGSFLYISIADLLPEIKHEEDTRKSFIQTIFFILGISLMYLITFME